MIDITIAQHRMTTLQCRKRGLAAALLFARTNSAARVGLWWLDRATPPASTSTRRP